MAKMSKNHSHVVVKCDDGKMRDVLTCRLNPTDLTGDGTVEWPPSGKCTCGDTYDYEEGMAVEPSYSIGSDMTIEEYQKLYELEQELQQSLERVHELTRQIIVGDKHE